MRRETLIVGGGVAAQRCAFALRARGFDAPVTIVGSETVLPYDRTWVSKQCLTDSNVSGGSLLEPAEAYRAADIELILGRRAAKLDVGRRAVWLDDGSHLTYRRLVICSGAAAAVPRLLSCEGTHVLRSLEDARRLRSVFDAGCRRIAIVGAGFVGGEVASSARRRGIDVTLIDSEAAPLARVVGREVAERFATLHTDSGVQLVMGSAVTAVRRSGGRNAITLESGRRVEAECVIIAVGATPSVAWLAGTPLYDPRGVRTDVFCRTAVPGIFAAGDCARWWHPGYGASMRTEHWHIAGLHGEAAAASVMGHRERFAPVPYFWSDQHGVKFQWVGHAAGFDELDVEVLDDPLRQFVARYRRNGRLVAALAAGQPRALALARRELSHAAPTPPPPDHDRRPPSRRTSSLAVP